MTKLVRVGNELKMKIKPIRHGTVIDHITAGQALNVLRILEITSVKKAGISVAMNVPSKAMNTKDIVKIEDKELAPWEVDKIALIAPNATINIIRGYEVVGKHKVKLPEKIEGIVKCTNPNCISNTSEPVTPKFRVNKNPENPIELRCCYCDNTIISSEAIASAMMW